MKSVTFSLQSAAIEFRVSRETLRRALAAAGTPPAKTYSVKEIVAALYTPLYAEKVRLTKARVALLQKENERRAAELVSWDAARQIHSRLIKVIKEALRTLPEECAEKTNPADPEWSRRILTEEVNRMLARIADELPAKPR